MKITGVVVSKTDAEEIQNMGINHLDTVSSENDVAVAIDYDTLDAGQKATVDAFYALAESLIPA